MRLEENLRKEPAMIAIVKKIENEQAEAEFFTDPY